MATITLGNLGKNAMVTKFVDLFNNKRAFATRSASLGIIQDSQTFNGLLSFNQGDGVFTSTPPFGVSKTEWEIVSGTSTAKLRNVLGSNTYPPLFVTYHQNYFRDIVWAIHIGTEFEFAEILMTYQVLPSEAQINAKNKYGITYVQEFEVTFA